MTTTNRAGFALPLTLVVIVAVVVLASAASLMSMTSVRVTSYYARQDRLASAAQAGLEMARARVNADPAVYPDSGYVVLEDEVDVTDALGNSIEGVTRSTYVGPVGITSGEYGVNGSIVSITRDAGGATVVRRQHVAQESFARFAYFTDIEPAHISFGGGDQIFGPVHTNDELKIYASGATFHGPVSTARDIQGRGYGDFRNTVDEDANRIPMPQLADLMALRAQAQAGGTAFAGDFAGAYGQATTRIEFVAVDLDGNGDTRGADEGFVRVYRSNDAAWVVGSGGIGNTMRASRNCGDRHGGVFRSAAVHPSGGQPANAPVNDDWTAAVTSNSRACYLGGAPELFGGFVVNDGTGQWQRWNGPVDARLRAQRGAEADYLFPITRPLNPSFKGVIYVAGDVAVSGRLRGRVTVAAEGDIVIADDVVYATNPAMGTCDDILGLFAGGDAIVANTPINAPWRRSNNQAYFSYDDTTDEFIHAFVLTLNVFTVESYDDGSIRDERCEGDRIGRGCLYLTGGIIQSTRGAVGTQQNNGGTGYLKRYSYDACGATQPPPYFPTTGVFGRGARYDVDPNGFDVDAYYEQYTAG